jgi:hypothetical protein
MKTITLLFTTLLLSASHSYAQLKVTTINAKNKNHYIATTIGYPVAGLYVFKNQTEPTTLLNEDGTGIFQNEELVKENIVWGIECSQIGIPLFKEGFDSATYVFWYKKGDQADWTSEQFSIHYDKKKMFISGERVKEYVE